MTDLALLGGPPTAPLYRPEPWPPITDRDKQAVLALLDAGELSYYGREGAVRDLEDEFSSYLGLPHVLAVSSGTAALHSAYFGLGIGPGDEVLAPAYTFLATVMPLFVVNAVPVLVDAEEATGNIDVAHLTASITDRSRAMVVTHMWGHPCDMEAIVRIAREHDLAVIEDCSHAHGACIGDRLVGTFGDAAVFSLQAKKLVAAGQGGLMVTPHRDVYERAILLGHFKVRAEQEITSLAYRDYAPTGLGLNYRMHPLAAAIARVQLSRLEEYVETRVRNCHHLTHLLADVPGIAPPREHHYVGRHAYYSYKPLFRPDEVPGVKIDTYIAALRAEGVPIERSDTRPLHLEAIFQELDDVIRSHGPQATGHPRPLYAPGAFPTSEDYANRALVLPPVTVPNPGLLDSWAAAFAKVGQSYDLLAGMNVRSHEADLS